MKNRVLVVCHIQHPLLKPHGVQNTGLGGSHL
jgi:hypothetical protein